MFERFKRKSLTATVAALVAALGVGGVAVAQSSGSGTQAPAASHQSAAPENSATDTDNIQSGDQTSPDPAGAAEKESATEQEPGSEVPGDDGPGGHADEPANPNASN
jgi:ABC-type phosphate transport system substrate-binding protein